MSPCQQIGELRTPALVVDLDAVESNVASLQSYCDSHGIELRPHIKTHKLPAVAERQLAAGAVGLTCQKVSEAEVMVAAGLEDLTITFPMIGADRPERFASLAREARLTAVADCPEAVDGLSNALVRAGSRARVLVDCDTGFGRTGVQDPADAAELAQRIARAPALEFTGFATFPAPAAAGPWLRRARDLATQAGLHVETVSVGGSVGARHVHELEVATELRAGTYVYGDRSLVMQGAMSLGDCALRVVATVVSTPTPARAILDAGSKSLTTDPVDGVEADGFGVVIEYPEARLEALSEEHGHLDVSACDPRPELGEVVTVVPNHACAANNLHNAVNLHRAGSIEAAMPIAARGCVE